MDKIIVTSFKDEWMVINVTKYKRLKGLIGKSEAKKRSHTHVCREDIAYIIKRNISNQTLPKTNNRRLLISHIRICSDGIYKNKLLELLRSD